MKSFLQAVRAFLRDRRNDVERVLHPGRRRRAVRRLENKQVREVLFVCLGNICRSPIAEHLMAERSHGRAIAASSGFIGPGRPPPSEALAAARLVGIEHGTHRSRVTTVEMIHQADAVFIFDAGNRRQLLDLAPRASDKVFWLGDFDPLTPERRMIFDPWGRPPAAFEAAFERIDRCVTHVAQILYGVPGDGRSTESAASE